jgi:hypothetical protein
LSRGDDGTVSAARVYRVRRAARERAGMMGMAGDFGAEAMRLLAEIFGLKMSCYSLRFPCGLKLQSEASQSSTNCSFGSVMPKTPLRVRTLPTRSASEVVVLLDSNAVVKMGADLGAGGIIRSVVR